MSPISNLRVWWATHQVMRQVNQLQIEGHTIRTGGGVRVKDVKSNPLMKEILQQVKQDAQNVFWQRITFKDKPNVTQYKQGLAERYEDCVKKVLRMHALIAIDRKEIADVRHDQFFNVSNAVTKAVRKESFKVMPTFDAKVAMASIWWDNKVTDAHNQAVDAFLCAVDEAKRSAPQLSGDELIETAKIAQAVRTQLHS